MSVPGPPDTEAVAALLRENRRLHEQLDEARAETEDLRHGIEVLHDVGIYMYSHPLQNALAYKEALASISTDIKSQVTDGSAVQVSTHFTFDNSLAKGRKMTGELAKLMLRAYNAEAENCIRYVKAGNLSAAQKRLTNAARAIGRYAAMMELRISPEYHDLRLRELALTADYQMKVQEEKEAEREERARVREAAQAERELRAERERLEKERAHYVAALAALTGSARQDEYDQYSAKISEIDERIAQNDYRLSNVRAGYVYVISNLGSFGPGVVKIGLTRRLEPMDRVRELGDASVPFGFDVHALFFSDDAVGVEAELHRRFAHTRVNRINLRREYFYASPADVKAELAEIDGSLLQFVEHADAEQYRQSEQARAADLSAARDGALPSETGD
jgi:hypothetical protein